MESATGEILRFRGFIPEDEASSATPPWVGANEAVRNGRAAVALLKGGMPDCLAAPEVTYIKGQDGRAGQWRVDWPRELDGYPFLLDRMVVLVDERTGKLLMFSDLVVSDECETQVRIGQGEAVHAAKLAAGKHVASLDHGGDFQLGGLAPVSDHQVADRDPALVIVTPNYYHTERFRGFITTSRETRLAYSVTFSVEYVGDPMEPHGAVSAVNVHVDAMTGKVIGGGF